MRSLAFALFCLSAAADAQPAASERDALIARQWSAEFRRGAPIVDSKALQDYLARLGARLNGQGFSFLVVRPQSSTALHAPIALPTGEIFVPVDLLLAANDEAEFAGMIAQAMARSSRVVRIKPAEVEWITFCGLTDSVLLPLAVADHCRAVELEADAAAVAAMARAAFDPSGLLHYIERLRPRRDARIAALSEAIRNLPSRDYEVDNGEFHRFQDQVRPAPPRPRTPPTLLRTSDR